MHNKPAPKKASTNEITEELEEVMELMDCNPDDFKEAMNDLISQEVMEGEEPSE